MFEKIIIIILTISGFGLIIGRLFLFDTNVHKSETSKQVLVEKIMILFGISFTMIGVFIYIIGNANLSSNEIGVILIFLGFGDISAGVLLNPYKTRLKGDWTSKQYKARLIIIGSIMIIVGLILLYV